MAVGFGFSVSDICMGFRLIKESVNALDDKRGAKHDYDGLLQEIDLVQDALTAVDGLLQDDTLPEQQQLALRRAVRSCQKTIEDFLGAVAKYQPHLSDARVKGLGPKLSKVRWAICRKEDIRVFRSQVERQASTISMLLIAIQTKQGIATRSLVTRPPSADVQLAQSMSCMSVEQRQFFQMIIEQNKELLQTVKDLRSVLAVQREIPQQVLFEQPVILLDPLGKIAPLHLEFIDSPECFLAVLDTRFSRAGISAEGRAKLMNQEFVLEDAQRRQPLNLQKPWSRVFRPAQKVDMSMVYHRFACPANKCPACMTENGDYLDDIRCFECGLVYQRFQSISKQSADWQVHATDRRGICIEGEQIPYILLHPESGPEVKAFDPPNVEEGPSLNEFRRVHIISQPLGLVDHLFPALKLIEDFTRFADLLADLPLTLSTQLARVQDLSQRAKALLQERDAYSPAFASFLQVKQDRKRLIAESFELRIDINNVVRDICDDPEAVEIVNHINKTTPASGASGYYLEALKLMVNLSGIRLGGFKTPKPISPEKVQWLMFTGRSK